VAVEKVEQAVDLLVDDFAEHPYRHRVEHSLHLQLYRALADHRQLDVLAPVGTSSLRAGLIHKEWPETRPGRDADRRGLFDLAVLAPSQLAQASIDQFRQGRIHAPIVVEVGLDYGQSSISLIPASSGRSRHFFDPKKSSSERGRRQPRPSPLRPSCR
jgi:hypothetical protein